MKISKMIMKERYAPMNIEVYNLNYLWNLVRDLRKENRKLKNQLNKAIIAYDPEGIFDERIESAVEYETECHLGTYHLDL